MAVPFVGFGSTAGRAGDVVSLGQVELDTQMGLFLPARSTEGGSAGARTASEAASQALGLRVLPQAWAQNTDTRRRLLGGKKARLRTQTWALCTAPLPPNPGVYPRLRGSSFSTLTSSSLRTGSLRAPPPTPRPLRVTLLVPELGNRVI